MRALQTRAWTACPRSGEALEAACRCGPALAVVPDSDRLCEEGYTALIRPGRFQNRHGYTVQCCVCLQPVGRGLGKPSDTCRKRGCREEMEKASRCFASLQEEWHQARLSRQVAGGAHG